MRRVYKIPKKLLDAYMAKHAERIQPAIAQLDRCKVEAEAKARSIPVGGRTMATKKVVKLNDDPRKLRRHLVSLTDAVLVVIDEIDKLMKQPSTVERGRQISQLMNGLEQSNDAARFFGLGLDYRNDRTAKTRRLAQLRRKAART